MKGDVLQNAMLFLTDTLLSLYALVFLLRFLFTLVQADFYNPLSQAVVKLTQAPIAIIRKFIPMIGKVDLPSLTLAYGLKTLTLFLTGLIQGYSWPLLPLLIVSLIQLTETLIYIYIFSLLILAVSSWFINSMQANNHPLISLLYSLTLPIITPLRRILPSTNIIDFTPLILLISLYFLLTILQSLY